MYKLFDVVRLNNGVEGTLIEEYPDGFFMIEVDRDNQEPELLDIDAESISQLIFRLPSEV